MTSSTSSSYCVAPMHYVPSYQGNITCVAQHNMYLRQFREACMDSCHNSLCPSPTMAPTAAPTGQPTTHPSQQPNTQPSSQPTQTPSIHPTSQPSCQPSEEPSNQPSLRPSSLPSNQPSVQPSTPPSRRPTACPSRLPTSQPSCQPSEEPSNQPSLRPSSQPSNQPSVQPSTPPSRLPTSQPSCHPSEQPSARPSLRPTSRLTAVAVRVFLSAAPTFSPTPVPTAQPTNEPTTSIPSTTPTVLGWLTPAREPTTFKPTKFPTYSPTCKPTQEPTTAVPSYSPTPEPTHPTYAPTMQPTHPTYEPTVAPSTVSPTVAPSKEPSLNPTFAPVSADAAVVTVQVTQIVAGVFSDSADFRTAFASAVMSLLPTGSTVTIISVTIVDVRHRQLLTTAVSVVFIVQSTAPASTLTSLLSTLTSLLSTGTAAMTAVLQQSYPAATVAAPTVVTVANPTAAPTNTISSVGSSNANSWVSAGAGIGGGVLLLLFVAGFLWHRRRLAKRNQTIAIQAPASAPADDEDALDLANLRQTVKPQEAAGTVVERFNPMVPDLLSASSKVIMVSEEDQVVSSTVQHKPTNQPSISSLTNNGTMVHIEEQHVIIDAPLGSDGSARNMTECDIESRGVIPQGSRVPSRAISLAPLPARYRNISPALTLAPSPLASIPNNSS